MSADQELTLLYVHGDAIGYARTGTYLAGELRDRDIKVYDALGQEPGSIKLRSTDRKLTDGREIPESPTNVVCWVSVPTHARWWWNGQHAAMFTMWEAMTLPESFREHIHTFDTIIVPSWHNLELFSQYHDNVHFVQLGVDPAMWHYMPVEPPTTHFNFFTNGRGSRKGVDLTYRAFRTVFRDTPRNKPTPRLIFKSMKGHGNYYGPNIAHVTGRMESIPERDLYASAHCYVGPSRGEGFGLSPLQAIALGRPTILTAAHGHASFAHLGIGISSTPKKAEYFIYGDAGDWWEPDFEELCEAMWDVYSNYDTHTIKARDSAEEVAQMWTWDNTASAFLNVLGDEMKKPYHGTGAHLQPQPKLFKVIINEDWYGEVAGRSLYFEKGKLYYETSDVKRIMFDAGRLDPLCIDTNDHGLTPEQAVQIEAYSAAHSYCPTCQQQLNTKPTLQDKLLAEMESGLDADELINNA